MKRLIFRIILLPISLLGACNSETKTTDFIPGTYVNQAQSNYSLANDTLVISPAENTKDIYLITKKTAYLRITDGKLSAPIYEVKKLTATWDVQKKILQIMQNGALVSFQPDQNKLMIQSSEYWKL